jgi:hypothetical protein
MRYLGNPISAASCLMQRLLWLAVALGGCSAEPVPETPAPDAEGTPPVYYLFEIHMHNLGLENNQASFNAISSCMLDVAKVFEEHQVRVAWGVMEHFALAVEKFETQESNLFRQLETHGHEIGVHSLAYDQDASAIMPRVGFAPKYSAPGFEGGTRPQQLKLVDELFLSHDYKILTGNFTQRPLDRVSAWQPSFDPSRQFTDEDGANDVLAVNQQGMGWVGANDLDYVRSEEFSKLNRITPWARFFADTKPGNMTVYNVAMHEDLFTTGPKMRDALKRIAELFPADEPVDEAKKAQAWRDLCLRDDCFAYDTECSTDALSALDSYLAETIDPLIDSGKVASRSYSELHDIYFGEGQ